MIGSHYPPIQSKKAYIWAQGIQTFSHDCITRSIANSIRSAALICYIHRNDRPLLTTSPTCTANWKSDIRFYWSDWAFRFWLFFARKSFLCIAVVAVNYVHFPALYRWISNHISDDTKVKYSLITKRWGAVDKSVPRCKSNRIAGRKITNWFPPNLFCLSN